jgi:transposase InsO family protein
MDQRRRFLSDWISHTMTRTALCALYGVSRESGYKWARRHSVEELSRRPHNSPNATPRALVKKILDQKRQFPLWGPIPLRKRLQTIWPKTRWPAASTIGDILKRHGLVKPRRKRLRVAPKTRPFSACREPNDVWCVDFKGQFAMRDRRVCYPLTVIDAATRFLLACIGFHEPTLDNVRGVFVELFQKYGLPKAIRSDNGEPFASVSAAAGLTQLSVWWARLGIRLERIDPGKPQQNGRQERFHLTLKQATCSPSGASLGWQQRAFDRFRVQYNDVRPHQALELKTPGSLYMPSSRRFPSELAPLHYPFCDVHRVRPDGTIKLGQRNQFISTTLAGEIVGLHTLDERYIQVVFADVTLGLIDMRNNNANPRYGLIRPRLTKPHSRSTRVSAMSPV